MSTIELNDSKGRSYRVNLYVIGGPVDIGPDATNDGVLITAKFVDDECVIVDMVKTGKSGIRPYFGQWDKQNKDGSWTHVSRLLGATHLGVIQVESVFGDELQDVFLSLIEQQETLLSKKLKSSEGRTSA